MHRTKPGTSNSAFGAIRQVRFPMTRKEREWQNSWELRSQRWSRFQLINLAQGRRQGAHPQRLSALRLGCSRMVFVCFSWFLQPLPTHMSLHLLFLKPVRQLVSISPVPAAHIHPWVSLSPVPTSNTRPPMSHSIYLHPIPSLFHPCASALPVHVCLCSVCFQSTWTTSAFTYCSPSPCLNSCFLTLCLQPMCSSSVSTYYASLGCGSFQVLPIVNKSALCVFLVVFIFSQQKAQLLHHMVTLCLASQECSNKFPTLIFTALHLIFKAMNAFEVICVPGAKFISLFT